ncbi:helix-turn-helix domain-containing protein [Dapis sp. BLCC M126]|uniref:helix-turn-helix domain-containing protein n=1 Tax=Dapis sp. BLCC M126 TaxID=3400189 RepID=UPI003CFB7F88
MFEFEQKSELLLEQKNLTFRHNHFLDLSELRSFEKTFIGEICHLGDQSFECYVSEVFTENIKLGLFQQNSQFLYRGVCLNHFTFALSAFHYGNLFSHKYKTDINTITIVYPEKKVADLRQKFHGNYFLFFEDEFFNNICETLELFEFQKQLNKQSIPPVIKADHQKINYIRRLCYQLYQLLFQINAQPDSSVSPLLINHYFKQKLEEEIAQTLIVAIAEATEIPLKKPQINRSRILKKAEEFYFSNLKSYITTQDLCEELKISQRTLEYIFKDYYQMSPQKYFKHLRLHALHEELEQKDKQDNLREITEEFGFYHRGQLAKDYYKLFGEVPSETFRR